MQAKGIWWDDRLGCRWVTDVNGSWNLVYLLTYIVAWNFYCDSRVSISEPKNYCNVRVMSNHALSFYWMYIFSISNTDNLLTAEMSEVTLKELATALPAFHFGWLNPHLDRGMTYVYPKYLLPLFFGTHLLVFCAVNIFHPYLYKVRTVLTSTNNHTDWLFTGGDSSFQSGVTLRPRWFWISWREYTYFNSMVNYLKLP